MTLVRNTATAVPELTGQFRSITFNLQAPAKVRHAQMNGREHLVVPCVMMTEGVHAGSEGPLLYTKAALAANCQLWNNKPVVVHHPVRNGANVSACDPDIIDRYGVGVLMNTRWEKDALRTECWLEEDKIDQVDDRVLLALNSEEVLEVSTGLLLDIDPKEGEWEGEKYNGIALNHRPDHLAILPDQKGACSVEDGAGLLRNAAAGEDHKSKLAAYHLTLVNELSASDLYNRISDKIQGFYKDSWVVDVWDAFFIYMDGKGTIWYQKYTVNKDDEVMLEGVRQAAEKETRYKLDDGTTVGNVSHDNKETDMTEEERKALADKAIANATSPFKEDDRDALMKMSDDHLKWTANAGDTPEAPATPPVTPPVTPEETTEEEETIEETTTANTVEEYIDQAPKGMQDMLRQGLASHNADKTAKITAIMANARNPFTMEDLQAKDIGELNAIAQLAEAPAPAPVVPAPHFGGQAPVAPTANANKGEEPLVTPVLNFDSE